MSGSNGTGARRRVRPWLKVLLSIIALPVLLFGLVSWVWECEANKPRDYYVPPPDTGVACPQMGFDELGDLVVAYQVNPGDRAATYLQKLDHDGNRMWGETGMPFELIPPGLQSEDIPRPEIDLQCDSFVFWRAGYGTLAGRLDINATPPIWGEPPMALGDYESRWKVLSGAAGHTVVWTDADNMLWLEGLDTEGAVVWQATPSVFRIERFEAVCDRAGNTWVAWWARLIGSPTPGDKDKGPGLYLQVFDDAGDPFWSQPKCLVEPSTGSFGSPRMGVTAGLSADAIVALEGPSGVVTLQRFDATGKTLWNIEAGFLDLRYSGLGLSETFLSDTKGGVLFLSSTEGRIRMQHVDAAGERLFGSTGMVIADGVAPDDLGAVEYAVCGDGEGGAAVAWISHEKDGCLHFAQRIDARGNKLWPEEGLYVGRSATATGLSLVFNDDSVYLSCSGPGVSGSHVQKIAADGSLPWGADGVRLDEWFYAGRAAQTTTTLGHAY